MALTELGERLALIIDAKTDGAVSNIRKLAVEEKAAADQAELLKVKIADLEARAARNPASKTTGLQLSRAKNELAGLESTLVSGVSPAASKVDTALSKMGLTGVASGEAIVGGMATAGAAIAAFGGFEFLSKGVEEYVSLASAVRQFQQASGASATDASKLVGISGALGVSTSAAALGVFRLGKQVALAPQNFAQYGIAIAKNADGSTNLVGTLENVAAAYQRTGDSAQRNAIVYQAFGRAGTTLLPILNANREELDKIVAQEQKRGHIFSQSDIDNAYQFQIATREMKDSLESLAVTAAKTLVPALTTAAELLTKVSDAAHGPAGKAAGFVFDETPLGFAKNLLTGNYKAAIPVVGPFLDTFGSHSSSGETPEMKAQRELAVQQTQALSASLISAAASTLSDTSLQAAPSLKTANAALKSATDTVKNAKDSQAAAVRALAKARAGSPVATSAAIHAAEARLHAAELNLQKAQYVGGDAGIASARSGVASAQASLNRLRKQGGVDTNALASAEERLNRANRAVAAAQKKEQAAQKAQNQAHGETAKNLVSDLNKQLGDKTKLADAQRLLVEKGASPGLIAAIDALNAKIPGSLVKISHTLTRGLVKTLNSDVTQIANQEDIYTKLAGTDADAAAAGAVRGDYFRKAFEKHATSDLGRAAAGGKKLPRGAGSTGPPPTLAGLLSGGLVFTGDVNLKSDDPKDMARKLRRLARHKALATGGGLRGPQ